MEERKVLLEVKNVSKIYGELHALKDVNLTVKRENGWQSWDLRVPENPP